MPVLPQNSPPSLVHRPESIVERLAVAGLFPVAQPLEVELGAGDGSFLVQYARRYPERNFLGLERLLGRLRKVDRKALRAGLLNLRLMRVEAAYFTEFLLPPESVAALHVYFPDPWPKRKHWPNRLINERFTEVTARVLAPGGRVYLRTDHTVYFQQMTRVFGANQKFSPVETPPELAAVTTDFERGFQARGVATLRAAFQRRDAL